MNKYDQYQQIPTNMNKYQPGRDLATTWQRPGHDKSAHCLPVEFALCENYVKSITWQPKSVSQAKPRTEINQT